MFRDLYLNTILANINSLKIDSQSFLFLLVKWFMHSMALIFWFRIQLWFSILK